jgi:hypothetical protein
LDDNIEELLELIKALGINLDENILRNMLIYSTSDK